MNKEANENWINTYIKNNPFRFKETIIHQCRQMDKADVYEWIADNELKIIHLQQKVNQLETNINNAIKIIDNYNCRKGWYENDIDKVIDNIKNTLLERGKE